MIPFTAEDISSWDCAYGTEVGSIIFNTAVLRDKFHSVDLYQDKLDTAVRAVYGFENQLQRSIHDLSVFKCSVTKGTLLKYEGLTYCLIHCMVRIKTPLMLDEDELTPYMNFVLDHLFCSSDEIITKNHFLLQSERPTLFFMPDGFPISSTLGLKFLLASMKVKYSKNDQDIVPFKAEDDPNHKGLSRTFSLPKAKEGSSVVKGYLSKDSFFKNIGEQYRQFFGKELCYMCGHKLENEGGSETWSVHLHEPHSDNRPMSLKNASKLVVMETCLRQKRILSSVRFNHPYARPHKTPLRK